MTVIAPSLKLAKVIVPAFKLASVRVKSPELAPVAVVVASCTWSALSSQPIKTLSELPLSRTRPMSLSGVPVVPFPNSINLSSMTVFVDDAVVVAPFTVKLPVTVKSFVTAKSFPIVTSSGKDIVTPADSEPEPDTVISFEVPATVAT